MNFGVDVWGDIFRKYILFISYIFADLEWDIEGK
jgi:hypothetical protein